MDVRININGVITGPEDARVSVLDHGFLYGDSVYETLRTYDGKPFLFSRHFARLEHSARGINLRLPWSRAETLEQIRRTLIKGESRIRLIVTRGRGDLTPDMETCVDPCVIIIVVPLRDLPVRVYDEGVPVVTSIVQRGGRFADIKTGSLIHQVLAFREAKGKEAFEAILTTADGKLSDGITSNIYLIREGKLLTPSREAGIVEGITRGVVLGLAANMGLPIVEGLFDMNEIAKADEMFLTSTTREVVPIASVDGKMIGNGRPGPITRRLLDAYREAVKDLIAED